MALGVGRRRTPTGGLNPKYVFRAFRKDSWFLILAHISHMAKKLSQ